MENLSFKQVKNICQNNDYVFLKGALRSVCINCKVASLEPVKIELEKEGKSDFYSFRKISFMEYISQKNTFL